MKPNECGWCHKPTLEPRIGMSRRCSGCDHFTCASCEFYVFSYSGAPMGCTRPGCVPWYEIQNLLRGAVWVISIFALLFALWAMVPIRTDLQNDDVRITLPGYLDVYGYKQFEGYDLGVISKAHTPPGLVAMHHALAWLDPLDAAHVVELGCAVLYLVFSWRVGSHLHGPTGGLLGLLLCIGMTYSWTRVSGGTARAFAPWMMAALIDATIRNNFAAIYRLAALASVTYPLITMVCGGVLVLNRKPILHPWLAVALVAGLWQAGRSDMVDFREIKTERIGANYRLHLPHSLASSLTVGATYRQTRHHDAFLTLARWAPAWLARWWQSWVRFDLQRGSTVALVLLYLVLPLVFWRIGWLRPVDLSVPIACVVVAAVAHVLAFRLYRPDRALLYCLPIWVGLLPLLLCRTKLSVAAFLVVLVATTGPGIWRWPGVTCVRDRQAPVFDWIEANTDMWAVFAGEPTDYAYECIPIYAHRWIYMSYEVSSPWWRDIQRDLVTPRLAKLKELLSGDPPDLPGVTHIILRDGVGPGAWIRTQPPAFQGAGYSIWELPSRPRRTRAIELAPGAPPASAVGADGPT